MPSTHRPDLLARLQSRFESRRPIRAGSLIVTLYGDAIAPRGGSLWLGSLNALVAPFGIEPGGVRTAMSRLVADGWFERSRIGKSSYYKLSCTGAEAFAAAGEHIYAGNDPQWSGRLEVAVLLSADARQRKGRREDLSRAGFGQLAPNVMLRPVTSHSQRVTAADDMIRLSAATADPAEVRMLAASCWRLDQLGAAYRSLLDNLGPSSSVARSLARMSDEEAFCLRVLAIHEWRRIVLHDPRLPRELLPADWPGTRARQAVAAIYRAASPGCERWLDAHAVAEAGRLPPSGMRIAGRFS